MIIGKENLLYFKLVNEYFDREFTDEELAFLEITLKSSIRNCAKLTVEEIRIAIDLFYWENGDILEVGRHNWTLMQKILKLDEDEFYCVEIWEHDDAGSDMEDQVATRVELKPVQVMKWVEVENG